MQIIGAIISAFAAIFAAVAAGAAWRATKYAKQSAEAAVKAATANAAENLRSQQSALSDANKQLRHFVLEHRDQFVQVFRDNHTVRERYEKPCQTCKNVFRLADIYVEIGVLKPSDIERILSSSSADIFLGVVERLVKVSSEKYDQRPFEMAARVFNKKRFPSAVQLIDQSISVGNSL